MFVLKLTRVTQARTGPFGIVATVAPATRVPIYSGCMGRARWAYDRDRREWRHLDASGMETTLAYNLRRVDCRRCGVRTELVPWADPGSRFTRDFEDHVAYLAQGTDRTTVATTMRIAWRTVGSIIARVVARLRSGDSLDGLEHIGVDELSYRKHHEYITVVLDHSAGRVVWAAQGKNAATLKQFFAALGSLPPPLLPAPPTEVESCEDKRRRRARSRRGSYPRSTWVSRTRRGWGVSW